VQKTVLIAKPHSKKRKTVHLTLWVTPELKAEIKRLADQERLSASKVGGTLLAEAIRQELHIQHAVLLEPMIEKAINQRMAALSTRLSALLVRGVLDIGQVRRLVINLLAREPGMTEELLDDIIDRSHDGARKQLTQKNPQLTSFIAEVAAWLSGEEENN
jgi:hypothetical protein